MPSADYFETPLGDVPIDREAIEEILPYSQVYQIDEAHAYEHSLEVQIPFLQKTLGEFSLVPLVVGQATGAEVAEILGLSEPATSLRYMKASARLVRILERETGGSITLTDM